MRIPDINVQLYAYDSDSPFHATAASWWQQCLTGSEPIGLPTVVLFGFVRVGTSSRAFRRPMTPAEAAGHVRSWIDQPATQVLESGWHHVDKALEMLEHAGTAGNLVTDAQIAAIAVEHDAVVCTTDADFVRFPGVRWFNPITRTGSRSLKRFR